MMHCVLFDLDGALINTWRLYIESYRRTLEPHFQRPLTDADIVALQPSAERRLLERVVQAGHVKTYFRQFLMHYSALHDGLFDGLYPGVMDLLRDLRVHGFRLGVMTGKSRDAWNVTSARSGLNSFDVVVTDDDVTHHKPHPEGLLAALTALSVPPSQAIYVGDSLLDCEAAKAAGVSFGAALWSKDSHEQARFASQAQAAGASESFGNPSSVIERLRRSTAPVE